MSAANTDLRALLDHNAAREKIAEHLNGLGCRERMSQALALSGKEVGRLYNSCAGGPELTLEDIVPSDVPNDATVIFEGRNSLPAFTSFQKRFARVGDEHIVGYNHQTMSMITGPGFFVVKPASDDADVPGELYFDYTSKPQKLPSAWPSYKPNSSGLSTLVYKDMKDYMRVAGKNVIVGKAFKRGKSQNVYFLLCRPD